MTAMALLLLLSLSTQTQAFFRLSCQNPVTIERADPIISPGKVAGHTHIVAGGSNFSPFATGADLRASECSSCLVKQDMSAYWSPSLYFQFANGSFASVYNQNGAGPAIYYKFFSHPSDITNITAFPDDFRMISGNSSNRDPTRVPSTRLSYICMLSNGTAIGSTNLPSIDCGGGIRTTIIAPSCWDGVNKDSPDHQSHIAWSTWGDNGGPCPLGFPVRIPALRYEITWNTGDFSQYRSLAMNPQQPFVFANGDPTGYGYHFDFFNGWTDRIVLQAAIDQCHLNQGVLEDCAPLSLYPYDHACRRTPDINEVVTGLVPSLPGNNPVNWGPAASPAAPPSTPPPFISNPSVYGNAPPPTAIVLGNTPRVLLSSGSWSYQGCYQHNGTTAALTHGVNTANKSVDACLAGCDALGYTFCAVGSGGWNCAGGSSVNPSAVAVDFDLCARICVDAPLEYCGGWGIGLMELYSRPAATTSSTTTRTTVKLSSSSSTSSVMETSSSISSTVKITSASSSTASRTAVKSSTTSPSIAKTTTVAVSPGGTISGPLSIQTVTVTVTLSNCSATGMWP